MTESGNEELRTEKVPPMAIKVLGGTFHVHEIVLHGTDGRDDVIQKIQSVPPDRWFVMASDHPGEKHDALSVIDDGLNFQVYAHGNLVQD